MAQQINDNFSLLAGLPIDDRNKKTTIAERDAISPTRRFQGLQCFVQQTQTLYMLIGGILNSNWTGIAGSNVSNGLETIIEGFYVLLAGKTTPLDWEVGDKFRGWIGNRYVVGTILTLPVSLPSDIDDSLKVELAIDSDNINEVSTDEVVNDSDVTGTTATDALNTLDTEKIPFNTDGKNYISKIPNNGGNTGQIAYRNLIEGTTFTDGFSINPSTGTLSSDALYTSTDYISITPNSKYYYLQKISPAASILGAWYDSNNVFVSGINLTPSAKIIKAPSNAYKIRISYNGVGTSAPLNFYLYKSLKMSSYGDSITYLNTWQPTVANSLSLVSFVHGFPGYKVSGAGGLNDDAQINTIGSDSDIIIMLGGTNDWAQSVPLGSSTSQNINEFYGALNVTYSKLKTNFPNAKIIALATTYGELPSSVGFTDSGRINTIGLTTYDYANAVITAAKNNNIRYVNTQNVWDKDNVSIFTTFDGGYIHPSVIGGVELGTKVALDLVQDVLFLRSESLTDVVTGTGTNGYVSFWNGRNTQTGDAQIFWDNIGKTLILGGDTTSTSVLKIRNESSKDAFSIETFSPTNGVGANILGRRYGGTKALPTQVLANYVLSGLYGAGYDGTTMGGSTGTVRILAEANFTNTTQPTFIDFSTTNSGSVSRTEKARITSDGNFLLNTSTNSGFKLDINGTTRLQNTITVSSVPATSAGSPDIITRNTANGVIEKLPFTNVVRPYKSYTALITQLSTSAPTSIVLENTLGGTVTFTYSSVGTYLATLTGAFVLDKTWTIVDVSTNAAGYSVTASRINNNDIQLLVKDLTGTLVDGWLLKSPFKIEVYN